MVSASHPLRVLIVSGEAPHRSARLARRLRREVPEATLVGLVQRRPAPPSAPWPRRLLGAVADLAFTAVHARRPRRRGPGDDLEALRRQAGADGFALSVPDALDAPAPGAAAADVVVLVGVAEAELACVAARGRRATLRVGVAAVDGGARVWIEPVGPAASGGGTAAVTLPLEPLDTVAGVELKTALLGHDLVVGAVAALGGGKADPLAPLELDPLEPLDAGPDAAEAARPAAPLAALPPPLRRRPAWKLLLRCLVFGPPVLLRNWRRRLAGRFPLVVLYYHAVADRPHHLGIATEQLLRHVRHLEGCYRLVSVREGLERLATGRTGEPLVALTFDDGYASNYLGLRAVAEETGAEPTLFVCTGNLATRQPFGHDLRRGRRHFRPLSWAQLEALAGQGYDVGSHTRSHFDCGSSDAARLADEIAGSRQDLEQRLGRPVELFSFPWGLRANMSPEAVALALRTYRHVFSAFGGVNEPGRAGERVVQRCGPYDSVWELELMLQSVLELGEGGGEAPARA